MFSILDYIKFIITGISLFDFFVFTILYLSFIIYVPFKTKSFSTIFMSTCIILFFIGFKILHLPIFFSTLPINLSVFYTDNVINILMWVNIVLIAIPLLLALTTLYYFKTPNNFEIRTYSKNHVNIIMPIYNENSVSLQNAIDSVLNLDYPKELLHLYLAFDEGVPTNGTSNSKAFIELMHKYNLDTTYMSNKIDIYINSVLISICRFDHGGKKSAQYGAFKMMEQEYSNYSTSSDLLVFFIDSDIILQSDVLHQFIYHLNKYNKSALTGIISCITSNTPSFLSFYQDAEYISGQMFWRNLEAYFGATTCLPGAFTILKYSFFKKVSDIYFNSTHYDDLIDYQRFYLGEDRYLTHLLMEAEPWQLGFCEAAKCKTDAPKTVQGLLKQRKRWYLGHIANDIWMMSSFKIWKSYPLLSLFNLLNNTRNTSLYIYIIYFYLIFNKTVNIIPWILFLILPILSNWLFIIIYTFKIKRKMNILFYIITLLCQPLINMVFIYYTIFNIKQKGWGGIRTDQHDTINTQNKENIEVEVDKNSIEIYIPQAHTQASHSLHS